MTLRLRLLLSVVAIVAAGLVVSDVVTYNALRSFLITRVDQQLDVAAYPVSRALLSSSGLGPKLPGAPPTGTTPAAGGSSHPGTPRFGGAFRPGSTHRPDLPQRWRLAHRVGQRGARPAGNVRPASQRQGHGRGPPLLQLRREGSGGTVHPDSPAGLGPLFVVRLLLLHVEQRCQCGGVPGGGQAARGR